MARVCDVSHSSHGAASSRFPHTARAGALAIPAETPGARSRRFHSRASHASSNVLVSKNGEVLPVGAFGAATARAPDSWPVTASPAGWSIWPAAASDAAAAEGRTYKAAEATFASLPRAQTGLREGTKSDRS